MRLSAIVFVSLVLVIAESIRFPKESSPYPRVPNGNRRALSTLGLQELSSQDTTGPISLKNIGAVLKPFQNYLGAGIVFMAILRLVQDRGLFGPKFVLPGFRQAPSEVSTAEVPTRELKNDQEEIWNAILNVHNIQKSNKAEIEANAAAILDLRSEQESLAQEHKLKMDAVVTRLDEIDQSLLELTQSVTDLTQSVDAREMTAGLHAVEDRVERESRATAASVKQIREELPEMMQRHDNMVTEKLGKFKEDLKRILTHNNKPSSGSVSGTNPSSSKEKNKSKNK